MKNDELVPHLFRTEYRKIVSVLCRHFGFGRMDYAEDIASDTFLTAAETWGLTGIPPNPVAWLYHVAKNKARNHVSRNSHFENKIVPELKASSGIVELPDLDLSPKNIIDSQLQMMFAICHPAISPEAQVGLALRILCGFGIEEIADAFLTGTETINKRLYRAKEQLREKNIRIEFPTSGEIESRLDNVLTTIYLLFNEGYYSESQNQPLRSDLCFEAMRLCIMLIENTDTNKPRVNALLSLMCFHASRFRARVSRNGKLILYDDQDTSLWNSDLISKGAYFLHCSATGNEISGYHLEAAIAYWHTQKNDSPEKWVQILELYNQLLQLEYSTVAALNRTYAVSKVHGNELAIDEAGKLNLAGNHFYFMLLGVLYSSVDRERAKQNFTMALSLAKTPADKQVIQHKIDEL
jgi:RNA polymerase sigma factor (sigma-70 family)